jgi:NAD+ synthase
MSEVNIKDSLKITLAQLNPAVGDVDGNLSIVRNAREIAKKNNSDLVVFPELFLSGYPPEDLVLKPAFIKKIDSALKALVKETNDMGPAILLGLPTQGKHKPFNSIALIDCGKIVAIQHKVHLPNYGVFDEKRVFEKGSMPGPVNFRGVRIGFAICEDIWFDDVTECLAETGSEIIIVPNGSPYNKAKNHVRLNHVMARVVETGQPLVYLNQVGGQDELVFDGASFVVNSDYSIPVQLPSFSEMIIHTNWFKKENKWVCNDDIITAEEDNLTLMYQASVLGLKDYVLKNGFKDVLIGLSGGIDSALVAAIAVDALGNENVRCIMLPSKYTSDESREDAIECGGKLKIKLDEVGISEITSKFESSLETLFLGQKKDITEENIQSRSRGVILMAISNKFNSLLITTGNKSEMAVGYATLYGDMSGAFNPLKDIYKTEVYSLAVMRNKKVPNNCLGSSGVIIPERIISKAPTAELRENQSDQDSLPPYDILDRLLIGLIEDDLSVEELVKGGFEYDLVCRIQNLLYISEYKRRQAPPGVKISLKNFGRDRRYPITNNYRDTLEAGGKENEK